MNRLKSHKFKLNASACSPVADIPETNNNNANNGLHSNSLLEKLSKRYSTLSNKITRRSQPGRSTNKSPQKLVSGSYDMTGSLSEDHRLEIGAPILISSTTLDADRFDVSEERLRMIGGGVAATNTNKIRSISIPSHSDHNVSVEPSPAVHSSSGSENEIFVDALSSPPIPSVPAENLQAEYEISFQTPQRGVARSDEAESSPESMKSDNDSEMTPINQMTNYYEASRSKTQRPKSILNQKSYSQSATNLHKTELKVYLQKAPSMDLKAADGQLTATDLNELENMDLPKLPELMGRSKCNLAATTSDDDDEDDEEEEDHDADKENSSPSIVAAPLKSKSEPTTPFFPETIGSSFLKQQKLFQSAENISQRRSKRRSVMFCSSTAINQRQPGTGIMDSKSSLASQLSINFDDYDFKSVSCQSLNPQSLFVSIDELNEITRQINEAEDFTQDIDLEYCTHRDQLKPSERRITLLKTKNSRLISFSQKEKIRKGWSGVKHWIGEESGKIRDVVQRQPLVQRIGSSKMNLSNSECKQTPSLNGSTYLKQHHPPGNRVNGSHERNLDESGRESKLNSSMNLYEVEGQSTDNLAEDSTEMNESFESSQSQHVKKQGQEGQNGFEELRRYVKQGGDFGKELVVILQERIDAELMYSKSLTKMANKLNKACRELPGSIAEAWRGVATEMETRSDIHKQLSASLAEELVKPLKTIVEGHHKTRKSVESNVDKAARVLAEWRANEAKGKKTSHAAARENEKLQDAMLDVRIQKSPSIGLLHQSANKQAAEKEIKSAEKDCAKLDNKRKKAEEAVKRADVEYYTLCVRAERARVDWEMSVLRGSALLQNVENQRLIHMKNFVANYARLTANMNPILENLMLRLQPQVDNCNVVKDMQIVKNIRRNSEGPSEQLLPDFYSEHTTLAMNRERRKQALVKLLQLVKTDLERERRSRNGLKGLSQSMNSQEHQNITDKLYHIRSMLTYLEGARFKLHSALLELDHKPRSSHPLAQHIQVTRDRTGLQQSILKVPLWLKNNEKLNITNGGEDSNDCDSTSPGNTTTSITNISGLESNLSVNGSTDGSFITKNFNRSKSNIENFSNNTQICVTSAATMAVGATTAIPGPARTGKSKTLQGAGTAATHIYDDTCSDDRGQADGGSNQQDSDFDEFSSQEEDEEGQTTSSTTVGVVGRKEHKANIEKSLNCENYYQNTNEVMQEQYNSQMANVNGSCSLDGGEQTTTPHVVLGRCKAMYNYTPKLYDELELNPGDIIEVHAKQDDGWWLGALRNQVGIFPATYVEEIA